MGSETALHYLQKIPKKQLGLSFDDLAKPDSLDMQSVTNVSVGNGKFPSEINNQNPLAEKIVDKHCKQGCHRQAEH